MRSIFNSPHLTGHLQQPTRVWEQLELEEKPVPVPQQDILLLKAKSTMVQLTLTQPGAWEWFQGLQLVEGSIP